MFINFGFAIIVLLALLIFASIKILPEYERGVMFTLGRMTGVKGPGPPRALRNGVLAPSTM